MNRLTLCLIVMLLVTGCAATRTSDTNAKSDQAFSFALIGDMPYADVDIPRFRQMTQEINADAAVEWVLHVGDIKTGGSSCSDEFLAGRLDLFQQFRQPFIFVPGDNEWTDCHRATAGGFQPLERLAKLRTLFYPTAGQSLGKTKLALTTQASNPAYATYPEHTRWIRANVVFAALHIVGSQNGMASFAGRTTADDEEAAARMEAAIVWMRDAFAEARQLDSPGIFLTLHANPGFSDAAVSQAFTSFLAALEEETIRFGRPVLLAHGDSHYFRIDKPLVGIQSKRRIENFTRVEVFGAGDVHWLRITVDPEDVNVFDIRQEIVQENRIQHIRP
ncbi:MAG: metallophosphoesterase [Bacteroidota bacterium]